MQTDFEQTNEKPLDGRGLGQDGATDAQRANGAERQGTRPDAGPVAAQASADAADTADDASPDDAHDPVFQEEQAHLSEVYATLEGMAEPLLARLEKNRADAAFDKENMADEIASNFASWDESQETWIEYASANRVVDAYNQAEASYARKLDDIRLLLEQPYFAKVALQFKPGAAPKEIYIGAAGISDDDYRRLIVDWRSPVAEVYYNQDNGPTSYEANGRTIHVDLKLRRQFDIERDRLNAYFDTTVAIQDSLLLASLSKRRTAHMKAITATIQKEQNQVIRHADVPALLVAGIAGSGKTSVLLQRIAYLFYRQRGTLDPSEVFLVTPNPVFRRYIDNVLPELGERNPETLTWDEFAAGLMPPDRSQGDVDVPVERLRRVDAAMRHFAFDPNDFRDLRHDGEVLVSANQIRQVAAKFKNAAPGPHLVALMREELEARFENRLSQLAAAESVQDEISALSITEQLNLFDETVDPQSEQEERQMAKRFVAAKYEPVRQAIRNDEWLRIDRIGMRLLGEKSLSPVEWLFVKMAVTGMGNPWAKYVMVDEVQDYTAAQLMVLARYFRRAHFLLLGDENQAIRPNTASFEQVRDVFRSERGSVDECRLMTSYRSSPEITALFAGLLPEDERVQVSSVMRPEIEPDIRAFPTDEERIEALAAAIRRAQDDAERADKEAAERAGGSPTRQRGKAGGGLTAVIVPWKDQARRLQKLLGDGAPRLVDKAGRLPESGVVLISLQLAKGLEFDHVIVPDASAAVFPDEPLARRRLYTTISRATGKVTVFARGALTPLLGR